MPFELPSLPYSQDALDPYISARTMSFHHGKHHAAYVNKLNELIKGSPMEKQTLEQIVRATANDVGKVAIFNNAAQAYNHEFFWHCLKPKGGGNPVGVLAERLNATFDSIEKFKEELKNAAVTQFGSGWAWLVLDQGNLKVVKTSNAMTPIAQNQTPLLTVDVWEHAYYLDYQNRRPDFVQAYLDNLVSWEYAAGNLEAALTRTTR
ncbi:MAG: superoxide dismutase [Deltaproteobacteria bacterium]|nr:superoxide dismutase [Deltaproteobacteria bacterium]